MLSSAGVGLDEDGRCEHEERQHTRRAGHVHVSELSLVEIHTYIAIGWTGCSRYGTSPRGIALHSQRF
jgi:hypothetical protein